MIKKHNDLNFDTFLFPLIYVRPKFRFPNSSAVQTFYLDCKLNSINADYWARRVYII